MSCCPTEVSHVKHQRETCKKSAKICSLSLSLKSRFAKICSCETQKIGKNSRENFMLHQIMLTCDNIQFLLEHVKIALK